MLSVYPDDFDATIFNMRAKMMIFDGDVASARTKSWGTG